MRVNWSSQKIKAFILRKIVDEAPNEGRALWFSWLLNAKEKVHNHKKNLKQAIERTESPWEGNWINTQWKQKPSEMIPIS